MKVWIASILGRGGHAAPFEGLVAEYVERLGAYAAAEARAFRSEAAFWEAMERLRGRTAPAVAVLDGRGKELSSEELAEWVGRRRDGGTQNLVFAVGPADGWSAGALDGAALALSLGRMTLPHELARVVLAEQAYRAFAILAGHPYHRG